jgi:glycosyltransferase involved in cell wall biosynthesis
MGVQVLRVLIDATAIPADRGGVGRYLDGLLAGLAGPGGAGAEVSVACKPGDQAGFAALGVPTIATRAVLERRPARLAWEQAVLPRLVRRERAEVLHCPHYTQPVLAGVATVVTIHDATFFSDPQLHSPVKARFFRTATRLAAGRSAGLVVPSLATRDELGRFVGVDADRITVAPHGVDHAKFRPPTDAEVADLRRSLELGDRPFVAFLGTVEPRKNVPNLVRGWVAAAADRPHTPALVIAGGRGWDDSVDAAIAAAPHGLLIRRPGYLPMEQLPALLGGADVVAYPSLGEGFGLPVAEAMACGAAVLTTRRLSLPEVGGDAVAYTEPGAESIAAALRDLLDDPGRRDKLRAAAVHRAADFTWERSARRHVEAFERASRRQNRPRPGGQPRDVRLER